MGQASSLSWRHWWADSRSSCVHVIQDLGTIKDRERLAYVLLSLALLIALSFEFVNGFHRHRQPPLPR